MVFLPHCFGLFTFFGGFGESRYSRGLIFCCQSFNRKTMAKKDWPSAWLAGVDRFSTAVGTKTNICLGHIPRIFPANGRHMWWIAECRISANMCKYCKGSIGIIWRFWLFVVQSSFDFCHHCWPVRCPSNSPVPWSMTLGVIGKIVPWYWWVGFPRIVIVPTCPNYQPYHRSTWLNAHKPRLVLQLANAQWTPAFRRVVSLAQAYPDENWDITKKHGEL